MAAFALGFRASDLWQRALPTALLGLALVGVPVLIFAPEGLPRMNTLASELSAIQAENEDTRRQIGALRDEVSQLRDEPRSVERIARDQLGLVRKNEIVVQFGSRDGRDRGER